MCDFGQTRYWKGFDRSVNHQASPCMSPVRWRESCEADYAFSVSDHMADNYCLASGEKCELSMQQIIDCTPGLSCHGGLTFMQSHPLNVSGIMREVDYPYEGTDKHPCRFDSAKAIHKDAPDLKYPRLDENELKKVIDNNQTVILEVNGANWQFVVGQCVLGTLNNPDCCISYGQKTIEIVGYGTNERGVEYWLFKNNWGWGWGDNGLGRIIAGKNCQNLGKQFIYTPMKSTPGECGDVYLPTTDQQYRLTTTAEPETALPIPLDSSLDSVREDSPKYHHFFGLFLICTCVIILALFLHKKLPVDTSFMRIFDRYRKFQNQDNTVL